MTNLKLETWLILSIVFYVYAIYKLMGFIAVVMWLILNIVSLGGLLLRIGQATNVYGNDAPEKVKEVIKSFLNR